MMESAAFAGSACYTGEVDPKTNRVFTSVEEYNSTLQEWRALAPQSPHILILARAYAVYASEKKNALAIGNDKQAHCYIGCRISQETTYRVAEFVGWLKEDRDIKDCRKQSHFDPADYTATVEGAQLGQSQPDATACLQSCKLNY